MCVQRQSAVFPSTVAEWTETVIVFILMQVLNEYFHNVCELDLVFNFYKVRLFFQNIQSFDLGQMRPVQLKHCLILKPELFIV